MSSCKSPQQMFGALAKTYYAEKAGIDPKDIYVVSVMPCTAKKFEAQRPEMTSSGYPDVDVVLTTRELGRMIREAGIDFQSLPAEDYDDPCLLYTSLFLLQLRAGAENRDQDRLSLPVKGCSENRPCSIT